MPGLPATRVPFRGKYAKAMAPHPARTLENPGLALALRAFT